MTRGEIKRRVRLLGRHYFDSDVDVDPFGLDLLITEVTNDVAKNTDCYWSRRYLDLVADTAEYCSSDLYRVKNIFALQDDGEYKRLLIVDWYDAQNQQYRDPSDTSSIPSHCVVFENNRVRFWPIPNVARTNGVMFEGWCIPGDYWVYDSNGTAVAMSDAQECPLPLIAHDSVVYGVLYYKALQARDAAMIPIYRDEFERRQGMVESFSATYARRSV